MDSAESNFDEAGRGVSHTKTKSFFFVGLINETKILQALTDRVFNIDHNMAGICTMQHEVSHN